jgi:hypothetical protein
MTAVATVPSTDITGLGTMSTQNATAVAITGGTINGTTIGATTPSTVNATTITGQTGVLRGTGTNLLLQSNTFNTTWTLTGSALTSGQSDPFGGSTAWLLAETAVSSAHSCQQTITYANNIFTISGYFKANQNTFVVLSMTDNSTGNAYAQLNLSTGVVNNIGTGISGISVGSWTNLSASATSVGNGWYRFSVTGTKNAGSNLGAQFFNAVGNSVSYAGTAGIGIFVYGLQVEIGSTTNSYVATTTTAVYGTPTLSFSGVSTIGLESNGSLFVQPAGTGALQAQATTSSTVGGNARGANAVDWQTSRGNAARVANGTYAVLSGGNGNSATAYSAATSGGESNQATGNYSFIGGGSGNTASGVISTIGGGQSNTAAGYYNFIGGGFTNSGTANAAVTTQSGTMNATTAVTLSGSNANIKVGQFITGTSIASNTYVAAISGTSLTLSQAASGSSTSTLSFFTPHGVVVGGGNNQATGAYSAILGGGDAGTAANRNVASGDWSAVAGGWRSVASGNGSFVGGGGYLSGSVFGNTASGQNGVVCGGASNTTSAQQSFIGGGFGNTANGQNSAILGSNYGTTRSIDGLNAFPASNGSISSSVGTQQAALLVLGVQTTDATATALRSNTSAAGTTNQVILPNNSAYLFKATVISNVTGGGNTSAWKLEGAIKRGANAASTAIVGTVTTTLLAQDAGAATWAIAATADTTNGGLRITFTGQASTTIRTVCKVETTEVTF